MLERVKVTLTFHLVFRRSQLLVTLERLKVTHDNISAMQAKYT